MSVVANKSVEKIKRHRKAPGMIRRLAYGSILERVFQLGHASDVAVLKAARKEDLVRNLAFGIHQQRLRGSIGRLSRCNPWELRLPPIVEKAILASAMKSQQED